MDGAAFVMLTREDIALIYPQKREFLLGSRLYREVRNFRQLTVLLDTSSEADLSLSDTTSVTQMPLQRISSKRCTSESSCHSQAKWQAPSSNIMFFFMEINNYYISA